MHRNRGCVTAVLECILRMTSSLEGVYDIIPSYDNKVKLATGQSISRRCRARLDLMFLSGEQKLNAYCREWLLYLNSTLICFHSSLLVKRVIIFMGPWMESPCVMVDWYFSPLVVRIVYLRIDCCMVSLVMELLRQVINTNLRVTSIFIITVTRMHTRSC